MKMKATGEFSIPLVLDSALVLRRIARDICVRRAGSESCSKVSKEYENAKIAEKLTVRALGSTSSRAELLSHL
jgi:hypothetical protein